MKKVCKVCGAVTERELKLPRFDGTGEYETRVVHCMCDCEKKAYEEKEKQLKFNDELREIARLKNLSLMDSVLKQARLKIFKVTSENQKNYKIACNYVNNFSEMYRSNTGLLLWGDVGTGKSYTAACIANELIDRQVSVVMTSFVKLIQDSFNNDYQDFVMNAKLLIIDDLGAERATDYALEKVYNIVDSRYRSGKPVVFTTNLTINQLKENNDVRYKRIYDRIFEMCYPVRFVGLSWRKKDAADRFEQTRKILEG